MQRLGEGYEEKRALKPVTHGERPWGCCNV